MEKVFFTRTVAGTVRVFSVGTPVHPITAEEGIWEIAHLTLEETALLRDELNAFTCLTATDAPALEQVARDMRTELGYAECGSPEHGAEMFRAFIDKYYPLLGKATAAPAPEQTTEEKLVSVLKDFVMEYASQTRGESE